ncbi:hypothetical protein Q8F55_002000 [Vanrija albida]|uniref:Flavodoxin-like domain-containing protein n=1 Tax=Vanrija albida TaxID=181172 RepID=A0ABR3Q8J0_9TREE
MWKAAPAPAAAPATTVDGSAPKPVIGVIFYSLYGHIGVLAEEVIKGIEATGAIAKPFQIQETLSEDILEKMKGGGSLKPKYPIATPNDLKDLDGFLLGAPTRYGRIPAQVSAFFDQTGGLWATGALHGKLASTFTSSATQHGGQETTHLTTFPFFAHHGIIYVPLGFTQPYLTDLTEIHGGSPYGVSTIAGGDGSRQPTEGELKLAFHQGEYFAKTTAQFVRGRHLLNAASGAAGAPGAPAANKAVDAPAPGAGAGDAATGTGSGAGAAAAGAGAAAAGAGAAGAAVAASNASAPAGAAGSTTAPAAAKALPSGEPAGYDVSEKAAAAPAAGGATAAGDATAPAPVAEKAAAAAAPAAPAAAPAPATDSTPAPPNPTTRPPPAAKKGGLFSCCSGGNID